MPESSLSPAYIVDATALIFRGYHGSQPMAGVDGTPTHAVHGFTQLLLKLMRQRRPERLCLAFDSGAVTFRNRLYPAYKANRGAPPEDLIPQFDLCVEVGRALGVAVALTPDFEADDLMATLAAQLEAGGSEVFIVSQDKDLSQTVTASTRLLDPVKDEIFGVEDVRLRFGVSPERVPDWLALVGDASDNIPGVPGVGAKTASALLAIFDGLDGLYADLDAVAACGVRRSKAVAESLARGREQAYLSRTLATVRRDSPLGFDADDIVWSGADPQIYGPLFERLGFGWLVSRAERQLAKG